MFLCLSSYLKWNSFWHARQDELSCERIVCWFNKGKSRVMCDNRFFGRFRNGKVLIFISLVLLGVSKRLKRENVPLFKLLFEMKFILMRQTRRAFLRANCMSGKLKGKPRVMCDNRFFSRFRNGKFLNFYLCYKAWKRLKRENVPLFKLLWKSFWRARQEFFRADCMYAMSIKTSDAPTWYVRW